ncbi:gamma-glutamyl-gamma-aminobutyrate hydrolase family protein [Lysinibacillus sp. KU-BSD001]|uniref:gamma-glutamyl-gamma-aminobutyrate hydrolase family protein n=1 Tax=Lysinibacillus sp. KU-BSD001 TaxID=3141328 RepID=UPI0036EB9299
MKPIIGVTMHSSERKFEINETYIQAVLQAGGIPLCFPHITTGVEEFISKIDGLLLIGGHDIHPKFFGEDPIPMQGMVIEQRDESDFQVLQAALKRDLPVFAVCRGHQVLNVAFGGSLYQDIPSQVNGAIQHAQKSARHEKIHRVVVQEGTKLCELIGSEVWTNSFHHQAIKEVGDGLMVTASTSDGMIEAIEHPDYTFCLGVQWHPEELAMKQDDASLTLFQAFVDACQK